MPIHLPRQRLSALLAAAALAASAPASAAPFATTYTGEIGLSTFLGVYMEQPYTATVVFDNGGSTADSQTWEASHLTCVIWRMNGSQNVVYAQDLAATPPTSAGGTAHTDALGVLDGFFTALSGTNVPASAFTASGIAPPMALANWAISGTNPVLSDPARLVQSTLGGVSVSPGSWSSPAPFTGSCAAPPPVQPNAVPTLGHVGLALMAALLGALGWRMRGRA